MDPAKEKIEELLIRIQVIDSTRLKRNLVGHFAGKRYNGHDVYVFASKSNRDAKKVPGAELGQDEMHLGDAATGVRRNGPVSKICARVAGEEGAGVE